jgi:Skp family chaperone for outer membrane proteins
MKRFVWIVAVVLTLALAFAASPAAAEKIGFVNVQEVMVTSTVGKKEAEDLKKGIEKTKATLQ